MKKIAAVSLVLVAISLSACGNEKVIDGVKYDTYGFLNQDNKKNESIQYEIIWGNVFWSVILSESIVAPIYFAGFSIFEPVGLKQEIKGALPL